MRRILLFFLVFTFFFADAQKGKGKKKAGAKKTAVAKKGKKGKAGKTKTCISSSAWKTSPSIRQWRWPSKAAPCWLRWRKKKHLPSFLLICKPNWNQPNK